MSTARHRKIVGTTRTGRIARLAGAVAVVGALTAGAVGIAAPANATTVAVPHGNLAGCVLPSGVNWTLTNVYVIPPTSAVNRLPIRRVHVWAASGAGHTYSANVINNIALAPDVAVANGYGAEVYCYVN